MKKKYFIFDFDGTLVNTNDIIIESWQATFEHYLGHRLPVRDILATFGETIMISMERMLPDADPAEAVEFYRKYQDEHQNEEKVYVFEGIADTLRELRARGCIIGIGTSRTESSFRNYMEMLGLDDLVDAAVTINDVSVHKPDPETIDAVLVRMMAHGGSSCGGAAAEKLIPDEVREAAVMVGDTKYDIGCANNAGVDSVLVGWSHFIDEDAMAAEGFESSYRMDSPEQLLDLI